MAKSFLDRVYAARSGEEQRALYDDWSASYDQEVSENGYATPGRTAALLAGVLTPHDAPILDFGCGTGLSGAAMAGVGFAVIDGVDISERMLATARARGVYRDLRAIPLGAPLDIPVGAYRAITAVGVIGAGAAPLPVLDELMSCLEPGGMLAFSFNDHTLGDPAYEARVKHHLATGTVRQLVRDYGDHLPGRDMKSMIYILEKK